MTSALIWHTYIVFLSKNNKTMDLEFNMQKDLTETYKQLKKMIATALGGDEFENIANPEARIVADAYEDSFKI